ncbi:translation initiation factor IF-2-like [Pteronotus mesoamericanus]|uniref:translation initiation factor IF-2-like n=1 Tax=Pteronotus mesoamericanus TaxID=1884717 RepID=UPI0023ED00C1|nr:translation initiation factor IF-2-like [Pteronotus parnellii mesoamericanus]
MPRAPQSAGPRESRTPGRSGELGARPPSKGSSRAAARGARSLGAPRLPPPRNWSAEVAGRGEVVGSRSDADPTADLRQQSRAAICPRRRPLRPGAARLAPPRPLPGQREAVPNGAGRRSAPGRRQASAPDSRRKKLAPAPPRPTPPRPWPVRASRIPTLCPSRAERAKRVLFPGAPLARGTPCEPPNPNRLRGAIPGNCRAPDPTPDRAGSGVPSLPAPTPSHHVGFLFLAS